MGPIPLAISKALWDGGAVYESDRYCKLSTCITNDSCKTGSAYIIVRL